MKTAKRIRTLLMIMMIMGQWAMAQPKPDQLIKLDKSIIKGKIDEITETDVRYIPENTQRIVSIPKKELWKIVFSDGAEEVFNDLPSAASPASSAGSSTDKIIKKDKSVLEGKIVKVNEKIIEYRRGSSGTGPIYEIERKLVSKIIYADGTEDSLEEKKGSKEKKEKKKTEEPELKQPKNKQTATKIPKTKTPKIKEPKQSAKSKAQPPKTPTLDDDIVSTPQQQKPQPIKVTQKPDFSRISFTAGVEGIYFLPDDAKRWTNDIQGLGLSQNIAFSGRLDFRPVRAVALSLNGGYASWELTKDYQSGGVSEYNSVEKFTRIPLHLGLKLYVAGGFYIMPEGGITLLSISSTTSAKHPVPSLNLTDKSQPISYSGSVGYEIRSEKLLVDISARYQITDIKSVVSTFNPNLNQPVHFVGLRVGIGFGL